MKKKLTMKILLKKKRAMRILIMKRDLPMWTDPFDNYLRVVDYSSTAACAAARRAIGTRNGEQEA